MWRMSGKPLYRGLTDFGLAVPQVVRNWNLGTGGDQDAGGVVTLLESLRIRQTVSCRLACAVVILLHASSCIGLTARAQRAGLRRPDQPR